MNTVTEITDKEKLFLNPNEMAFRKIYKSLLEKKEVTTIFRPGRRLCGDYRGYCSDQEVTIKIIDKTGADWAMLPPKFVEDFSKKVIIKEVLVKTLGELTDEDFIGTTEDVRDITSLKYHLGVIYNLSDDELTDDFIITKTIFEYK
ncbi:MAG: hypothetical protein M0P64_01485 [Candidatus Pacebacteria bacterium]|jgi:hypothetical protein|nr:hypothetical protein [Candidatus Paceibacterota bacterium]